MNHQLLTALVVAAPHPHDRRWIIGWIVILVIVAAGIYLARGRRAK